MIICVPQTRVGSTKFHWDTETARVTMKVCHGDCGQTVIDRDVWDKIDEMAPLDETDEASAAESDVEFSKLLEKLYGITQ